MSPDTPPPPINPPRHFANAAEWHRALGNVPLERIVFDPWPGTATEVDLLRFVERDKRLCELIDGTLVEKPPGFWEGLIAARLGTGLSIHADKYDLGAVSGANSTMRMKSGHVRLPTVGFISKGRLPETRAPIPTLAPDLSVEVLRESNTVDEMALKLIDYFQSGTRLAWIIDPSSRTVAVYHAPGKPDFIHGEHESIDGEEILPGLLVPIADLFRNIPENG